MSESQTDCKHLQMIYIVVVLFIYVLHNEYDDDFSKNFKSFMHVLG